MSLSGLFGGGGSSSDESKQEEKGTYVNEDGKEVIDGYEVADSDDMEWLAGIL